MLLNKYYILFQAATPYLLWITDENQAQLLNDLGGKYHSKESNNQFPTNKKGKRFLQWNPVPTETNEGFVIHFSRARLPNYIQKYILDK